MKKLKIKMSAFLAFSLMLSQVCLVSNFTKIEADETKDSTKVVASENTNQNDNQENNESRRDKYAPVITSLSDKGYSFIHNDHQHFIEELPDNNSKFLEDIVVSEKGAWEPEDVIAVRKKYFIIKAKAGYKVAVRKGVNRDKLIVKRLSLNEEQNKALSSKSVQFEDGYVFDPKDIVDETEFGYIVRHGDHFHFVPKDGKELDINKSKKGNNGSQSNSNVSNSHNTDENKDKNVDNDVNGDEYEEYKTDDGYVFNPKDIVMEDEHGYVVRHGDHFHYIYKKDLKKKKPNKDNSINNGSNQSNQDNDINNTEEDNGQVPPSSDNKKDVTVNSQGLKADSDIISEEQLAKVKLFAQQHNIELSKLSVRSGMLIWPHHDHFHADPIDSLPNPNEVDDSDEYGKIIPPTDNGEDKGVNEQGLMGDSEILTEDQLAKVKYFAEKHGIELSKLSVKGGVLIWPHIDHYHADPVDTLPDPPKDTNKDNLTEQGLKEGSDTLNESELKKVDAQLLALGLERKNVFAKDGKFTIKDPKSDRQWEYVFSDLLANDEFPDTEETNDQGLKLGSDTVSKEDLQVIKKYANSFGLDLSDIYVKNGLVAREKFGDVVTVKLSDLKKDESNQNDDANQGLKEGSDKLNDKDLEKIKKFAENYELNLSSLTYKDGKIFVEHHDHQHIFDLSEIAEDGTIINKSTDDNSNEGETVTKPKTNSQGLKEGSVMLDDEKLKKAKYFAETHHLDLALLQATKDIIIWPHEDHFHATFFKDINIPEDWVEKVPMDPNAEDTRTDEEAEAAFIKELNETAVAHNVKVENVALSDDGTMTIYHGDHSHVYKIREMRGFKIYRANMVEAVKDIIVEGDSSLDREKVKAEIAKLKDDARYYFHNNVNQYKKVISRLEEFENTLDWGTNSTEGYLASLRDFKEKYFVGEIDKEKIQPINENDLKDKKDVLKEDINKILLELHSAYSELEDVDILTKSAELRRKLNESKSEEELINLKKEASDYLEEVKKKISEKKDSELESEESKTFNAKLNELSSRIDSMNKDDYVVKFSYFSNKIYDIKVSKNMQELEALEAEFNSFIKEHPEAISA